MADETMFERRLVAALGQYADLAPTMDDELVAQEAIRSGGRPRFGWLGQFAETFLGPGPSGRGMRLSYLLVLLALLLAALLAAVVGGFFRTEAPILPGLNGAIVYTVGPNNHRPVTSVAIHPDGQGIHQIEAGRCPAYSRDGKVLAWMSYEEAGAFLVVAGADGSASHKVLLVESAQQAVPFELSPEGTRVAWVRPASTDPSTSELWVAPLDGSAGALTVPASTIAGETYGSPTWSPDGHWISFGTYVKDGSTGETRRTAIDVVAADGSDRHRLTARPGPLGAPTWSPDSRRLAFVGLEARGTTSRQDIFVIGTDGSGERNLTASPTTDTDPVWSPDGAALGFLTSADDDATRLATLKVDDTASVEPVIGPESEWFVWSPDGRELLWSDVVAVDAETNRTTLHSIDREFREPARTLQVVDGLIVCTPSWQRLDS